MAVRRERVERELTSAELSIIAEMASAVNVPFSRWTECPQLARPWFALAVERAAERIRGERRCSWTAARVVAAVHLGLQEETIKTWRRRWRKSRMAQNQGSD